MMSSVSVDTEDDDPGYYASLTKKVPYHNNNNIK